MSKRLLVVADVSNLYYCVHKRLGGKLDYEKLYAFCQDPPGITGKPFEIYRAIAYGSDLGQGESDKFRAMLGYVGFETKYKVPKIYAGPDGRVNRKSDWDVGIAMDIVSILPSVDIVVLCSADGDMVPCLEYVRACGKRSIVIGSALSSDLRVTADHWFEITPDLLSPTYERV